MPKPPTIIDQTQLANRYGGTTSKHDDRHDICQTFVCFFHLYLKDIRTSYVNRLLLYDVDDERELVNSIGSFVGGCQRICWCDRSTLANPYQSSSLIRVHLRYLLCLLTIIIMMPAQSICHCSNCDYHCNQSKIVLQLHQLAP